jgi:hypothetical protein
MKNIWRKYGWALGGVAFINWLLELPMLLTPNSIIIFWGYE